MIYQLAKISETLENPPIKYKLKIENNQELINHTFENYVYRGKQTQGSWNNPSWNGVLKSNNFTLKDNPIYLKIIRNIKDNSSTFILRVSKKSILTKTTFLVNDHEFDLSNIKEIGNDYYEYQIFTDKNGNKIEFNDIHDVKIFSIREGRWRSMSFGIHLKNISLKTNKTVEGDLSYINQFKYNYIYEINYKITQSTLAGQTFIEDKNSSFSYIQIQGIINDDVKFGKPIHKLATLKYYNYIGKQNKIIPMKNYLLNSFYLSKYKFTLQNNQTIENVINFDKKIDKTNENYWKIEYLNNQNYSYYQIDKKFINDSKGKYKGYLLPLNFQGQFNQSFEFMCPYNKSKNVEYTTNNEIHTPFFDKYNGQIKLKIDKSVVNWNLLEKNHSIWKYIKKDS